MNLFVLSYLKLLKWDLTKMEKMSAVPAAFSKKTLNDLGYKVESSLIS